MGSKKKTATNPAENPQPLKIGGRVRRTEDGVSGRIVWANGVSVKITWDDGEQVTWRRDSLAGRPVEILLEDEDQAAAPSGAAAPTELGEAKEEMETEASEATATEQVSTTPEAEAVTETPTTAAEPPPSAAEAAEASEPAQTAGKPKRRKKSTEPQEKKLSAIDAAAKVLAETHTPMTCQELIGAMAAKGYWTSPGGKTPGATLYSALLRETQIKGTRSRFTKTERGKFDLAVRG
jgi:HB1, ASXL, restriction endonuclease HTH domain